MTFMGSGPRVGLRIVTGALLPAFSFAPLGLKAEPPIPPADTMPRTADEWRAEESAPWRKVRFRDRSPEAAALMDALLAALADLNARFSNDAVVYDERLSDDLVSQLYLEQGDPVLNRVWQQSVVDQITEIARWPAERLPEAARRRLTTGVLEYAAAGGGRYSPAQQAELAEALDRLAPEDADSQLLVEGLLRDALNWVETVDSDAMRWKVHLVAEDRWGDAFVLRVHEAASPLAAGERPRAYTEAVGALEALLNATPASRSDFARKVDGASELALTDTAEEALNADLTTRLLLVYRRLLARRPMIPQRVADHIDYRLWRLAGRSERLKSDADWRLWTQAVHALGQPRVSRSLRTFIRSLLESKNLSDSRRKALESLRPLVTE